MKPDSLIKPSVLLALAIATGSASAVPVQYTNKALFLLALGAASTEDFESNVGSFAAISTPFTTANGYGLVAVTTPISSMQILPGSAATVLNNGTQRLHFRDFTAGLSIILPNASAAFGFDYGASEVGWQLTAANGVNFTFPGGPGSAPGFIGYIDLPSNLVSSFTLTGPSGAQGGLTLDNITIGAVPEPASYAFFALGLAAVGVLRRHRGLSLARH